MAFEPKSSMSTAAATRNRIAHLWHTLSQRNDWCLVDNPDTWIDQVAASLPDSATPPDQEIAITLQRAYSARLYRGLLNREDRAARELWRGCARMAYRMLGLQHEDAEEVAQETMVRVLEKFTALRSPQALVPWAYQILRSVLRDRRTYEQRIGLSLDDDATSLMEIEDPAETPTDSVEQSLIREELLNLLKSKIPNDLERLVLLRVVLLGDRSHDVARELGLPLHRLRIAKSRAVARLRNDEDFLHLLAEPPNRT